jgi:hypothetical protein
MPRVTGPQALVGICAEMDGGADPRYHGLDRVR